jgi:hypothetical protein
MDEELIHKIITDQEERMIENDYWDIGEPEMKPKVLNHKVSKSHVNKWILRLIRDSQQKNSDYFFLDKRYPTGKKTVLPLLPHFSFPGVYQYVYIVEQYNEEFHICPTCANENIKEVFKGEDDWNITDCFLLENTNTLYTCDRCSKIIGVETH